MFFEAFKVTVTELITKQSRHQFKMDYYDFGERIMLLMAAYHKFTGKHYEGDYLADIAANWASLAKDVVEPPQPFTPINYSTPINYRWTQSEQDSYLAALIERIYDDVENRGNRLLFIQRVAECKDVIEARLPFSRDKWTPYYGPLDYELVRRQGDVLATFTRFEGRTRNPKALLELMTAAKAKRLPNNIAYVGLEPLLFRRKGRCFVLKGAGFEVFDAEIAVLCKLSLEVKQGPTDCPLIKVYPADLDKNFKNRWLQATF